jgi:hypothetical protein
MPSLDHIDHIDHIDNIDGACEVVCARVALALPEALRCIARDGDAFANMRKMMLEVDAKWYRELHTRLFDELHGIVAAYAVLHETIASDVLFDRVLSVLEHKVCVFFEKLRLWMRLSDVECDLHMALRTELEEPAKHALSDPGYNDVLDFYNIFMRTRNAFEMLMYSAWGSAQWEGDHMVCAPDMTPILKRGPKLLHDVSRADMPWCYQKAMQVYLELVTAVQSFRMQPPDACEWYSARHVLYHRLNTAMYKFFGAPYEHGDSCLWTTLLQAGFVGARNCRFTSNVAAADKAADKAAEQNAAENRVLPRAAAGQFSVAVMAALHPRLGSDSALADLNEDLLQEVLRHVFVSSSDVMPACPMTGWQLVTSAWSVVL